MMLSIHQFYLINRVIERILPYARCCCAVQCIICGTDNGRGEGFNDFPCRNKFVIYIRILEGNEKTRGEVLQTRFSLLSGAHVNGLLMSPYVLYRFAFNFCYYAIIIATVRHVCCPHSSDYCSTVHPVRQLDVENCIQLLHSWRDFFYFFQLGNDLLIYLYCSSKLSKDIFGYF